MPVVFVQEIRQDKINTSKYISIFHMWMINNYHMQVPKSRCRWCFFMKFRCSTCFLKILALNYKAMNVKYQSRRWFCPYNSLKLSCKRCCLYNVCVMMSEFKKPKLYLPNFEKNQFLFIYVQLFNFCLLIPQGTQKEPKFGHSYV